MKLLRIRVQALIDQKKLLLIDGSSCVAHSSVRNGRFYPSEPVQRDCMSPACHMPASSWPSTANSANFSRSKSELDLITRWIIPGKREGENAEKVLTGKYAESDRDSYESMCQKSAAKSDFLRSLRYHRLDGLNMVASIGLPK